ncbi:MAG TPA: hypothetical protein PLR99_17590 [Polyangiaceae bacterium]|nr:hypothetical protein [Polyangiaceae bacterium]
MRAPRRTALVVLGTLALATTACSAELATTASDEAPAYGGEAAEEAASEGALTATHAVEGYTPIEPAGRRLARASRTLAPADVELPAGATLTALRELRYDRVDAALVVDDATSRSYVVRSADLAPLPAGVVPDYLKALRARAGVALKSVAAAAGTPLDVALTVDMCQSSKPWDKSLFDWVVRAGEALGRPLPVGVAMTGGWAKAHEPELAQLLAWNKQSKLDIVWINHSFTHPLHCNAARTSCAFLTASSVDLRAEVTKNEELLLGQGQVPSALFRFPGLVHDATRRAEVAGLGLFALDADAWLAKGERAHDGAVILVHGNGNEPAGIRAFLSLVDRDDWAGGLRAGRVALVSPLRGALPSAR